MRRLLIVLLGLCACGDPGLRDRSLMAKLEDGTGGFNPYTLTRKGGPTSVIGLAPDQLAPYYPDDPTLVVRFKDLASVGRETADQAAKVRAALGDLGLPAGEAADLLRQALQLPPAVLIDPVRPFAFVRVEHGWAAIIPTRSKDKAVTRLNQLDAVYCVAGDPGIVASYRPGFRKGFYLPGDVSLIADPKALGKLGTQLTEAARPLGLDLSAIDGWIPSIPSDIERIDAALRLELGTLRLDVRAAPSRDSPTAVYLERMRPESSGAARWLPARGTAYVESTSAPLDWEGLLSVLLRDAFVARSGREEQLLFSLRRFLAALGADAAAALNLPADRAGSVLLVARLDDPKVARAFLDSVDLKELLAWVAGPEGDLAYRPAAFTHSGITVGSVQGHVSRTRLLEWRKTGDLALITLSVVLRGPAVAYFAVVDDKLCVVVGQKGRPDMEQLIDHVLKGRPVDNDHHVEAVSLFPQRLAAATIDLAALYNGLRDAAPYWHPNGRALRDLELRWHMPAAVAVTIEGGALRAALRFQPPLVAESAARVRTALERR